MMYLGDFPADQAIYFMWNTNDADGASITRSTDGAISVYKDNSDGSSFNQTQVTTGVTNDEDVDSLTGVHSCCITTTNAWYETGHDYVVVLSASTIDTQTVNVALAHFSIQNRFNSPVAGATATSYTVNSTGASGGTGLQGVYVWATTDAAGTNVVANETTNSSGVVTFYLDSGSTYYIWKRLDGYTFDDNPETITAT